LISEYAKQETTWTKLKATRYPVLLIEALKEYLISNEEKLQRENEKEADTNSVEESLFLISEIHKMGLTFWDGFRIYIDSKKLDAFNYIQIFDLVTKLEGEKNLTIRELSTGKKVLDYVKLNPTIIEEVKSLSKLKDKEVIEVKFIYDKLLLLSKEDWSRVFDIATQTKIFNLLELSNVKSIQTSLLKKEIFKEQALIKCYESLKKLKKFGIKV